MESGKKRGRGGWALAGFGVLTLLALYVGVYYRNVLPWHFVPDGPMTPEEWDMFRDGRREPYYECASGCISSDGLLTQERAQSLFAPIHLIDRQIRWKVWQNNPLPASLAPSGVPSAP